MIKIWRLLSFANRCASSNAKQYPDENRTVIIQYEGEITWEVSSTITKDNLHLRFLPMVRIFYTIQEDWGVRIVK